MEIINFNKGERFSCAYPIGSDITNTIELSDFYAKTLAEDFLKKYRVGILKVNFWVTGSSGAILGALVTQSLLRLCQGIDIRICHIKKPNEESHQYGLDFFNSRKKGDVVVNVVLDDFISTGSTMKRIYNRLEEIQEHNNVDYLCVSSGYQPDISIIPKILITA